MKVRYNFDDSFTGANNGVNPETGQRTAQQLGGRMGPINTVLTVNIGDFKFTVEPRIKVDSSGTVIDNDIEIPAKILKHGTLPQQFEVLPAIEWDYGPHQDYAFVTQSDSLIYETQEVVGTGVVVKKMAAGAKPGHIGIMFLYKGATALEDIRAGSWTARLVREFVVTAADIADRESGWPQSGSAPTVSEKKVIDQGGDGYLHI